MEKPFWVSGPVPPAYLDSLALPRPQALGQLVASANDHGWAEVGGAPGSGRTTLLHQAARALGRPLVVVDLRCLLRGDEAECLAQLAHHAPRGGPPRTTWEDAVKAWDPAAALAFDGYDAGRHDWVPGLLRDRTRPVLAVGEGPIEPDPVPPGMVQAFLERRTRRLGIAWTGAALREASGLVAGDAAAMQAIGAVALRTCLERRSRRVLVEDVLDAAVEVARQAPFGSSAWQRIEGPRRSLLLAMALEPDAALTSWANRCGIEPKAAVVHLGRLAETGLVTRAGRGRYVIAPLLRLALQPSGGAVVRLVRPTGPFAAR